MIKQFLRSKLLVLFISLFIIGFFLGYNYTVLTSRNDETVSAKNADQVSLDKR